MHLSNGQKVGDGLEGVVKVGEGVENGDGRVFGEVCDVGVRAYAGDDGRGHAGEDARGVVERFVDLGRVSGYGAG